MKTDLISATDNWKRRREKEGEGEKKEEKGIILTHQKPPTIYSTMITSTRTILTVKAQNDLSTNDENGGHHLRPIEASY